MSRRHKQEEHSLSEGELNLVPYLDIIVNLNMFMLLTFQVVLEMKVINFNPPASGPSTDIVGKTEDDQKVVVVTVLVKENGQSLTTDQQGAGAIEVPKIPCSPPPPPAPNDVCFNGKAYDYKKLREELEKLQKRTDIMVDRDNLIVVAEPAITYDHVVSTLDAARYMADEKTPLFPHVTLGLAVGSQ